MSQELVVGRGFGKLTLKEAVDKATVGDMILVEPGEYELRERIDLKGAQLIGTGATAQDVKIVTSVMSSQNTRISNVTINCDFDQNTLWIGNGVNIQVTECILQRNNATQYPTVVVKNASANFENCQMEFAGDNSSLLLLEGASTKVSGCIIQGIDAEGQSNLQVASCEISHRVYVSESSVIEGTDVYFTEPTWWGALYAISGAQIKFQSVEFVGGETTLYAEHGLIQVAADNTEVEHKVTYEQDEQSTVEFPGATQKVKVTSQNEAVATEDDEQAAVTDEPTTTTDTDQTTTDDLTADEEITDEVTTNQETEQTQEDKVTGALADLYHLIGLTKVKNTVTQIVKFKAFDQQRIKLGKKPLQQALHSVFLGNPGTGKTTVARLLGQAMYEQGVLPKSTFKEVGQQDLISSNMGQTAELTQSVLESADGGVLFIDEAYSLYKEDYKQQGQEAVDTILKFMEDHRDSIMIIFAGYTKEMQDFLDINPGLRSRIPNVFDFEDYTPDEIAEMGTKALDHDEFSYDRDYYIANVKKAYGFSTDDSNGRWVRNFNEKLEKIVAERIISSGDLTQAVDAITHEDIDQLVGGDSQEKAANVDKLLTELDGLIGLHDVKEYIHNLVAQVKTQKQIGDDLPEHRPTYHMIFAGDPGTGKTTVARILAELFYNLDILPSKTVLEVDRTDLVGHYIGDTEKNTTRILKNAMGGVLFVDEAYQLSSGGDNDFGKQAIETILPVLENERDKFIAIFAGYTDKMDQFLRTNPGLSSRVPLRLNFESYTPEEIGEIVDARLSGKWQFNHDLLKKVASDNYKALAKADQGNARWARTFGDELIQKHMLWLGNQESGIDSIQITDETIQSMSSSDGAGAEDKAKIVNDILSELDAMTGLASVKKFVHDLVKQVRVNRLLADKIGQTTQPTYHMFFEGPAGTGKTTVARMIAKLFYALDILPRDTVKEVTRTNLVGKYVGQSEAQTQQAIDDAMGGVLFIDEAYQLTQNGSSSDFGGEVINTLLTNLENHRTEFVTIFAGYTDEMERFLNANEGLRSRIPLKLEFDAYTPEEIGEIVDARLSHEWEFNHELVRKVAVNNYKSLAKVDQGNARWARTFSDELVQQQMLWLANQADVENPKLITDATIQAMSTSGGSDANGKEKMVNDVLAELDAMIGLASVKKFVHDLVKRVRVNRLLATKIGESKPATYHMIFEGPAGTGKTTVARMIAKLFYALDILPRNTVKEVTRTNLVGKYIGQSEAQTQQAIDDAMGGVLFVDEAYQLTQSGSSNDFGGEVINTLLTNLENHRTEFVAIFAGYTDDMEHFLDANEGLRSRIPLKLEFDAYLPDEVALIAEQILDETWQFDHEFLKTSIAQLYSVIPVKERGNARWARNIASEIDKAQRNYLADHLDTGDLNTDELTLISNDTILKTLN